jgi:hypothetical protein
MSGELPQLFLFVRGQIRLGILRIATDQVNPGVDHNVQIYDSCAPALPLAFRRPSQLARSPSARNYVRKRFYPVHSNQVGGFGFEFRQLQDCNFGASSTSADYTAMRYKCGYLEAGECLSPGSIPTIAHVGRPSDGFHWDQGNR